MVKTFTTNTRLSPHFVSNEFRCKCCGKTMLDVSLVSLLERLFPALDLGKINIISGWRCPLHDKAVGGRGAGSHVEGYAADVRCYYKDGSVVPSSVVALTLERMGHNGGIGYRCGSVPDRAGNIHIDVKPRKWYGDEAKSMTATACSSFFDYLNPFFVTVIEKGGLNVRSSPTFGKVVANCAEGETVRVAVTNAAHTWGKTDKGWICLKERYVHFGRR